MDDVEQLHVGASATCAEVFFQGGIFLMRYFVKGFVSGRETAIKRASVDTSTEYIVACTVVVIVVVATYLSLLKT
jgi:hypothetical protein